MINIQINLVPGGVVRKMRPIGTINIVNDGTGTGTMGNYRYLVEHKGKTFAEGEIKNFPRKKKNVIYLLGYVLSDIFMFSLERFLAKDSS